MNIFMPILQDKKKIHLYENDRYGLKHSVVVCLNCTLVYENPRMTSSSLEILFLRSI